MTAVKKDINISDLSKTITNYADKTGRHLSKKDGDTLQRIARATAHLHDLFETSERGHEFYETFTDTALKHIQGFPRWVDQTDDVLSFIDILTFGDIVHEAIKRFYVENMSRDVPNRKPFLGIF